ncbi:MAG TPA: polysaccharide biosynthesis C-terminal domain-containing protein, partial [Burkholderiales bacterium]|nr:polysaccharide biosynthesis C-terminal domain-containing protein [Burkholderiales bacterium]
DLVARAFQAFDRPRLMMVFPTALALARLLAFAILLCATGGTLVSANSWALAYLTASAAAAAGAVFIADRMLGRPRYPPLRRTLQHWDGAFFALGTAATRAHAEIDKALQGRFLGMAAAGAYSAACRLLDLLMLPVLAVLEATMMRFFRAGAASGPRGTLQLARELMPPLGLYAALASALLLLSDRFVPLVLGPGYATSATIGTWLSLLPAVLLLRQFLVTATQTSGNHRFSAGIQCAGAAVTIGLNLLLIPIMGWRGSLAATLASELLMSVAFWLALQRKAQTSISGQDVPGSGSSMLPRDPYRRR